MKKKTPKKSPIQLDNGYVTHLIKISTSNKDLGKKLNKYYKYLKTNA